MKVVDGFLFSNELDLLECRLETLDPVVDRFVLCEATTTFQGAKKPLHYAENRDRYSAWHDRIEHLIVELPVDAPDAWAREHFQRDELWRSLGFMGHDDVFMLSDVDEIPSPEAVLEGKLLGKRAVMDMRWLSFAVDWEYPERWPGTIIAPAWATIQLSLMRYDRNRLRAQGNVVEGGWHFTWLGDPDEKVRSFAHAELVDTVDFGRCYRDGYHTDDVKLSPVDVDDTYPKWMRDNCPASWRRP
jgi:hypothetical protein